MNILITVTNMTIANGGVNTHIIDLCDGLLKFGERVVLVTDENQCDYKETINCLRTRNKFVYVSMDMRGIQSNPRKILDLSKKICDIVKEYDIDLIHTHSQSLCLVAEMVKLRTKIPFIWTNHIDAIANPIVFKKVLQIFRFSIISVSTDLKNMLIKDYRISEKRIFIINNGINLEHFEQLPADKIARLKNEWECNDKYVIGILARMVPIKGHRYLIKAISLIQRRNKIADIKLLIAGKAYDEEYLEEILFYCKENNIDVKYVGFQKPRNFFGVCNISVLPSVLEGFGLTVLESLAMECPVIRSDTPGYLDTKEITRVFKKEDIEGLADHLLYAYKNKKEMKKIAELGKIIVQEKFTIENQVRETMKAYKDVISK